MWSGSHGTPTWVGFSDDATRENYVPSLSRSHRLYPRHPVDDRDNGVSAAMGTELISCHGFQCSDKLRHKLSRTELPAIFSEPDLVGSGLTRRLGDRHVTDLPQPPVDGWLYV